MLYLTHDIDWLNPWHPYSVVKFFTRGKNWLSAKDILNPNVFLQSIKRLIEFNEANGLSNNIWLIGGNKTGQFKRYGLRYDISTKQYKKMLAMFREHNLEIGLHSTTYENLSAQAETLGQITQKKILFHRSHFLFTNQLKFLKQTNIKVDFTFGKAREVFLQEIPPTFHLSDTRYVPTILLDNIFFDNPYFAQHPEKIFSDFTQTLKTALSKQQPVAILFHPENMVVFPALWEYYAEIIRICKAQNVVLNPSPALL